MNEWDTKKEAENCIVSLRFKVAYVFKEIVGFNEHGMLKNFDE